jgi:hypothetical protein
MALLCSAPAALVETGEALTGLDYPFGLAIGPDRKLSASTAETIFRFDPLRAGICTV